MLLFEWLVRAAVLAALVGVGAWALDEVLRSAGRSTRFVWVAALALSLILPALALLAPDLWPDALKRSAGVIVLPEAATRAGMVAQGGVFVLPSVTQQRWSWRGIVLGVWLIASLVLALRWLYGWLRLHRARRRCREAILAGERVLVSENLGPAVVGLTRPRVVIPSWLLIGDAAQQRMIVRHEVEHLRAGDQWLLAFAPVLVALFPWNPALWWQLQRLRIAIELDCDARVLRAGESALEYGSMLLDVASSTTNLQPIIAGLSEPRTSLERRIRAMTPVRYRHALTRAASLSTVCALMLAGAVLAVAPTAQPAVAQQQERPRVAAQQQQGSPLVVVDGRIVSNSRLDFDKLQVESIEVLKPEVARRKFGERARYGAVVVVTRSADISIEVPTIERAAVAGRATAEAVPLIVHDFGRGTVAGQVISATGEPVVNAQVTVGYHNAITDRQGRYVIRDVPAGAQQVVARTKDSLGRDAVVVEANAVTAIGPVVVTALTEADLEKLEQEKVRMRGKLEPTKLEAIELKKVEGTLDLTKIEAAKAVEVLQAKEAVKVKAEQLKEEPVIVIDGVQVSPVEKGSIRNLKIQGASTPAPLLIIDGVLIGAASPDAMKIIETVIGRDNIDSIEVVKGEAARRLYGEQGAQGVIQITTKKR